MRAFLQRRCAPTALTDDRCTKKAASDRHNISTKAGFWVPAVLLMPKGPKNQKPGKPKRGARRATSANTSAAGTISAAAAVTSRDHVPDQDAVLMWLCCLDQCAPMSAWPVALMLADTTACRRPEPAWRSHWPGQASQLAVVIMMAVSYHGHGSIISVAHVVSAAQAGTTSSARTT